MFTKKCLFIGAVMRSLFQVCSKEKSRLTEEAERKKNVLKEFDLASASLKVGSLSGKMKLSVQI